MWFVGLGSMSVRSSGDCGLLGSYLSLGCIRSLWRQVSSVQGSSDRIQRDWGGLPYVHRDWQHHMLALQATCLAFAPYSMTSPRKVTVQHASVHCLRSHHLHMVSSEHLCHLDSHAMSCMILDELSCPCPSWVSSIHFLCRSEALVLPFLHHGLHSSCLSLVRSCFLGEISVLA